MYTKGGQEMRSVKILTKRLFFLTIVSFTILLLGGNKFALADRMCVHGSSGEFQTPSKVPSSAYRFGNGLTFKLKGSKKDYDWIHYSIPTDGEVFYSAVRIRLWSSQTAMINRVHLYDGGYLLAKFDDPSGGYQGYKEFVFDLPKGPRRFWEGAGISINVGNMGDWQWEDVASFRIYSVCLIE
jgi:hypothetical protein